MSDNPVTTIDVQWQGGFKFASDDGHGHNVIVDAPQNEGDDFDGMMPGGLLLSGLAGCSGIDVVNILQRQRQNVTGIEIKATGEQLPDAPWTYTSFHLEYTIKGKGLDESRVRRAIELSEEKYCSVGATLKGKAAISSTYRIIEES
jgi:putative redox protein